MPETKVVLITGASSGIGYETALLLAARGYRLALAARRKDRLDTLAGEIWGRCGVEPLVLPADLSKAGEPRAAVAAAAAHFGRLDVIVNNAGILRMAPFLSMSAEEMRDIFETNFWAPLEIVRSAAPLMERLGGGRIVQVGSAVSRRGLPFMAAYAASKAALLSLTESLRLELAHKRIGFSLVLPGGTDTEMPNRLDRARLPPGYPERERYRIPALRAARAVVRAVTGRSTEIYVPWWVRPGAWLCGLWPGLADRIIRRGYGASLRGLPKPEAVDPGLGSEPWT